MTALADVIAYLAQVQSEGDLQELNDKAFAEGDSIICMFGTSAEIHFDAADDAGARERIIALAEAYYDDADVTPNLFVQEEFAGALKSREEIKGFLRTGPYKQLYDDKDAALSFYIKGVAKGFHRQDPSQSRFSAVVNSPGYRLNGTLVYAAPIPAPGPTARAHVDRFVAACSETRAYYAVSGAALLFGGYSTADLARCYPIYQRFPGFASSDPNAFSLLTVRRKDVIRDVNWLTAVSSELLERVGGPTTARSALGESVVMHDFANGVVFQAGERPQIGDANVGEVPEAYREVSRFLAPLRFEEYRRPYFIDTPDSIDPESATDAWVRRFD